LAGVGEQVEFKRYTPQQGQLLPAYVGEALDPSDPALFIDELVEGLDLRAFERRYARRGERAYPPRMLLKLWLLGAVAGVFSGRELARRLHYDLRFRYLAGELRPDFRTINRFRERHREDFRAVFLETLRVARAMGLGKLGRVAVDGTKIRANTSRSKAMSHGRMVEAEAQLRDEIGQILQQMEELNAAEDEEFGDDDDGGGGLPEELQLRERRLERIRAAREQLEREKGEKLESRHQKSFADPEANMMKTGDGALAYCYNAQAASSEDGLIVANDLSEKANDYEHLEPLVDAIEANTGEPAELVLADSGYLSEPNLEALERRGQRALIAVSRAGKGLARRLKGLRSRRMHRTLRLPWAQERYAWRKTQAERPFAEIKARQRFVRFMLRGKAKVRGEWDLVCAAFNVSVLWRAAAA
jgi:transposase